MVVCGDVWWFWFFSGGLWWFAVICGGLSFSHTGLGSGSASAGERCTSISAAVDVGREATDMFLHSL